MDTSERFHILLLKNLVSVKKYQNRLNLLLHPWLVKSRSIIGHNTNWMRIDWHHKEQGFEESR